MTPPNLVRLACLLQHSVEVIDRLKPPEPLLRATQPRMPVRIRQYQITNGRVLYEITLQDTIVGVGILPGTGEAPIFEEPFEASGVGESYCDFFVGAKTVVFPHAGVDVAFGRRVDSWPW